MIRIYSAGTTDFDNNGIGVLSDVISAKVTEERNGIFELEFTYPITGLHYGDIIPRNIVVSKPDPNSQPSHLGFMRFLAQFLASLLFQRAI